MGASRKQTVPRSDPLTQEIRDQEVLRAYRELAAYFKGDRTEREARGALKIIKAFIRDRERVDPANRRPLPGLKPVKTKLKSAGSNIATIDPKRRRHSPPEPAQEPSAT